MTAVGKDASPGKLSLLFLIVKAGALVLFNSQDVPPTFDTSRLIETLSVKLYRRLHVVSQDCISKVMHISSSRNFCSIPDYIDGMVMYKPSRHGPDCPTVVVIVGDLL